MARGVNKVILIGNLGNAPDIRTTQHGEQVANFTLATNESYKDKTTGQPVEKVEWHKVVCFKRLAEIAGQYLAKGSKVYIEGKLQSRKWQDESGIERYTTEIIANGLNMLDSASSNAGGQHGQAYAPQQAPQQHAPQGYAQHQAPQQSRQQAPQQGYAPPRPSPMANNPRPQPQAQHAADDFDDDIPF